MTMPKSKLGFLLAAVYVFVAGSIFIYVKFVCNIEASLYCGTLGFKAVLPVIFFGLLLNNFLKIPVDFSIYLGAAITLLIIAVLFYFIGSFIQRKFSPKITRAVSIGLIIAAIVIMGILGIRYFNKSDMKPNFSPNVNGRGYCQQDSDCVLTPQYQGCCPNGCEVEAVNVETENKVEEIRNKQYNCHLKDISCPQNKCSSSVDKRAVCEQNRCVVKEETSVQTRLQEFEVRQIADDYAEAQGYNLSEYQSPEIVNSKIGEWHLFYDQIYLPDPKTGELMGAPGKHFSIFINDNTGEAKVYPLSRQ